MAITKIGTPELFDFSATNTALQLPAGDTASRPTSPSTGEWRYNTDDNRVEYYDGAAWFQIDDEALPVACTTDTINYPTGTTNTAYYKMSDATDSTLNAYNGTPTNVDFNVQGKFGNAGSFNGSSSKIVLPNSSFQTAAFTISAWCNVTANGSENSIFEFTDTNSGNNQTVILLSAGSTSKSSRFLFRNRTTNEYSYGPSGTPLSGWNHYCMTFDGSTVKSYINGSEVDSSSFSITNTIASTSEVLFGLSAGDRFLNGKIDQVRIFSTALTDDNVTSLYNEVQCVPAIIPSDYFNPLLYTGNNNTQSITSLDFTPDFVWIKQRSSPVRNHLLFDTVRGPATNLNILYSDLTNGQDTSVGNGFLSSISTNALNLGSSVYVNGSGEDYVAWNWKAGGAPTATNSAGAGNVPTAGSVKIDGADSTTALAGTLPATRISANTESGFSVVTWTGNGTAGATIAHGIDTPEIIITKNLSALKSWTVYSKTIGNTSHLYLDVSNAAAGGNYFWNATSPTDSVFSVSSDSNVNSIGVNYLAYCFHSVPGMSDIGSYVGTGATGNSIVTGFRPAYVMLKRTDFSGSWNIIDNRRGNDAYIQADTSAAEGNMSTGSFDLASNGFILNNSFGEWNASGGSYIYLAIAEQVYSANGVTANQTNPFNDGSQVAQYEFEDNADDSQPNGYIGKGGTFNGTSSKVVLLDAVSSSIATASAFTISMWFNISGGSGRRFLYFFGRSTYIYLEIEADNTLRAVVNASGGSVIIDDSTVLSNNVWYNAVLTGSNASNLTLYLNGSSVGTASWDGTFGAASGVAVNIGNENNALYFNGSIDQVRIYNTALNPNDVWLLYSETSVTSSTLDYPASTGAIALYELEGNAYDTGGAYNGADTAVAWVPLYDGNDGGTVTYAAPSVSTPFLKAGEFNGTSGKIVLGTNVFNSLTSFSFSCWVNLNNAPSTLEFLFDGWDYQSASSRGIGIRINSSGNVQAQTGYSNSVTTITSSGTISYGNWNHIVASITQSNTTISINGSTESPQSNTGFDFHTGTTYNLGAFIYTTSFYEYFLDGELDQVRIFNKALDEGEVLQLYNEPNN